MPIGEVKATAQPPGGPTRQNHSMHAISFESVLRENEPLREDILASWCMPSRKLWPMKCTRHICGDVHDCSTLSNLLRTMHHHRWRQGSSSLPCFHHATCSTVKLPSLSQAQEEKLSYQQWGTLLWEINIAMQWFSMSAA